MTLDEAIEFCNEKSKNIKLRTEPETFEQIVEWLEELKILKSLKNCSFMTIGKTVEQFEQEIRCKAIDDFLEKIQWEYLNSCGIEQKEIEFLIAVSSQVAEQLKAGASNGNL